MSNSKRIFIGNITGDISRGDIENLFSKYGVLDKVEIKEKKSGFGSSASSDDSNPKEKFAFVEFVGKNDSSLSKCLQYYGRNPPKVGGNYLKISAAKESFMERLQRERREQQRIESTKAANSSQNPSSFPNQSSSSSSVIDQRKYAVPSSNSLRNSNHREYHSSSSEDEDENDDNIKRKKSPSPIRKSGSFVHKLESFDGDFWNNTETSNNESEKPIKTKENNSTAKNNLLPSRTNKKIKLASDSEEEEEDKFVNSHNKKKNELFDSDDEDDDDNEDLKIKPQFEGKSGQKLLNLQAKFSHDDRFKIDERFYDENNDEPPVKIKKKDSKSLFKDTSKLRYDPSIEPKPMEEDNEDDEESDENDQESPAVEKLSNTNHNYYNVMDNLKSAFSSKADNNTGKNSSTGFSLLSAFGRADESSSKTDNEQYMSSKIKKSSKTSELLTSNPFKYDSSDSEDEENEKESSTKTHKTLLPQNNNNNSQFGRLIKSKTNSFNNTEPFFLIKDDPRFEEGLKFFKRSSEEFETIRSNFQNIRPGLAQVFKNKLKNKNKVPMKRRKKFNNKKRSK